MFREAKNFFLQNLRTTITSSLIVLAVLDILFIDVSWVTLVLIALAVLPWMLDYVKTAGLPGFGEVDTVSLARAIQNIERRETPERRDQAPNGQLGALAPDMQLVLARRDLEIKIRELLGSEHSKHARYGLGRMVTRAGELGLISNEEQSLLLDLIPILNEAVHGQPLPETTAIKAMSLYADVVERLGQRNC